MMRLKIKGLAVAFFFTLILPVAARAANVTQGTNSDLNNGASMTSPAGAPPAPSALLRKPHRRQKKTIRDSTAIKKPVTNAGGNDSHPVSTNGSYAAPGISDNLNGNDAGKQNMGSPDHVPGTTGTSGQ